MNRLTAVSLLFTGVVLAGACTSSGNGGGTGSAGTGAGTAGTSGSAGTGSGAGATGQAGTGSAGSTAGVTGTAGTGGPAGTAGTGVAGTTGGAGAGGVAGTTGQAGTGGGAGAGGGAGGAGGRDGGAAGGGAGTGGATDGGASDAALTKFSFFVTSIEAMRALSGSQDGFGGDLLHGETTGLAGADKICREVADRGMPGAGAAKTWRAFLSATTGGPNGGAVNAIDRIGEGPWYDRLGRLVAMTKADLQQTRPRGANTAIINDLPNETGTPNHGTVDNHDTLTGSNTMGMLLSTSMANTCNDWTINTAATGKPGLGHSWPAQSGMHWIQSHTAAGCTPGVNINGQGGPPAGSTSVGAGGGYGGFYCFALTP